MIVIKEHSRVLIKINTNFKIYQMTKMNITQCIVILTCLLGGITVNAQFSQTAKVVSDNREDRAEFGTSVSIVENFAAVGASRETFAAGAAYVYSKDGQGAWSYSQRLSAFDPNDGAEFGGGIKFSTDYLVVAAGRADVAGTIRAGALYIYDYQNNNWEYSTKLVASDYSGDAKLGMNPTSLAVEGNTIVAGAPGDNVWTGSVYVFTKNAGTWSETQKILSPTPQASEVFGIGVAISGDYMVVGANEVDGRKGAAYVYLKDTNGVWQYNQTLMASDAINDAFFGTSVSMLDDQLVIGAYGHNLEEGAAYVFEKDNQGMWIEVQKLNGGPATEAAQFGWTSTIQTDHIVVTAPHIFGFDPGEAYFYQRDTNGLWVETQVIQGDDTVGEDFYGWSIALHEDQLIAGAPWEDHDANGDNEIDRAGSAYIFKDPDLLGGLSDSTTSGSFTVYPIPASDYITITSTTGSISKIKLINQLGMMVMDETVGGTREYRVNISGLAQGFYFVDVYGQEGERTIKKIIKIK